MQKMEVEGDVAVSPSGQYLNSSTLSLTILAILELETQIEDIEIKTFLKDLVLPMNPRFSSIMTGEKTKVKKWKHVDVQVESHIKVPKFHPKTSPQFYDECLNDYLSNMATVPLPQNRPLWEVHIINYQTSHAPSTLIFKLHHALGDGYTLIGTLLSCSKRADNPSLPLTFPSIKSSLKGKGGQNSEGIFSKIPRFFAGIFNTCMDFGWSILKGEDDRSPIRSANEMVEVGPRDITTITFSLDRVKQIKDTLNVTINDVITGIIFLGSRMYMEEESYESRHANSTALVVFNTRNIGSYKSINDMVKPGSKMLWGNQFTLSHVSIPKLNCVMDSSINPLHFIMDVHKAIKRKKNSAAVYITAGLIEKVRKFKGPEAAAGLIHSTLKNSSIGLSNLIGPVEQVALANHRVKGFYFSMAGAPLSLGVAIVSYMRQLRVAITSERDYVDAHKLKSCIQKAFDLISVNISSYYSSCS